MAVPEIIENIEKRVKVTLNGTVTRGDAIAWNGTGYVRADCNYATTQLYARFIALDNGVSGGEIDACRGCTIYDGDAPFSTTNTVVYISATATSGNTLTETRPTTAGDVIQIVGQNVDTYRRQIFVNPPHFEEDFLEGYVYNCQTAARERTDLEMIVAAPIQDTTTDEWAGIDVDAARVAGIFTFRFPSNIIALEAANVLIDTQANTTLDMDVTVVACYDNDTNTGDAGTTTTGLTTSASPADNQVQTINIKPCMSSTAETGFVRAGRTVGIRLDPDAGDFLLLGLYLRYLVV